ncbi:hypothetical protein [Arthrobacter bambusae]|uniref:hypothetical protein n=1 Tax=Arthrobacter bambusae TaxID=1338426 RepID=UPI00278B8CAC|nr:hypothetical protein [Arthrobacter bambusae]MDQ0030162.1 hypothetical protein [Arthrobacter bambusae]MDQ0097844.1 hypothetical protein [Arthrobacter bambusae]
MTDPYGIPDNMFRYELGEFPALVGRVVMVAAVVEMKLEHLVMSLSGQPQEAHAGKGAGSSVKLCRRLLRARRSSFPDESTVFAERVEPLLNDVESALYLRNDVVHSSWPVPGKGWRNLPDNQREARQLGATPEWTKWVTFDEARLGDLLLELCGLVDRLADAIALAGSLEVQRP